MLNRFATLAAVCMLIPVGTAPLALADPPPDPAVPVAPAAPAGDDGPPPDTGVVASADPGVVTTPDGWVLTVVASNESQLPIAPLTTAVSSREYLVAGTFTGTVTGKGKTTLSGGSLEAGYQIGCGIELGQVRLIGSVGIGTSGSSLTGGLVPTGINFPISGTLEIHPKPGTVSTVTVDKKTFKAAPVRVTLKDTHIKVDGCVGQSFLRSYATMTSSTTDTDDVVAYYGVTKAV
jgi:MspA